MGYEDYYKPKRKYAIMSKELVHDVVDANILQSKIFKYEKLIKEQIERIKILEQEIVDLKEEIELLKVINEEC
jgi:transposase